MPSETIINVTDEYATIGAQGRHDNAERPGGQRGVYLTVLSRSTRAESVRLYVYGERQTRELAEGLEATARALRSTLPDVEPDDVEVAGDALSGLAEAGGR